jgi:hypothetical protein
MVCNLRTGRYSATGRHAQSPKDRGENAGGNDLPHSECREGFREPVHRRLVPPCTSTAAVVTSCRSNRGAGCHLDSLTFRGALSTCASSVPTTGGPFLNVFSKSPPTSCVRTAWSAAGSRPGGIYQRTTAEQSAARSPTPDGEHPMTALRPE